MSNVLNCLRKPSEDEALHGARVLAIMALIQGGDEERFFQRASNVLTPLAKTSRSAAVKAAVHRVSRVSALLSAHELTPVDGVACGCQSMRALAVVCFVCSVEDENTQELLVLLEKYHDLKIAGSICSVALEAWGLLASSLSDEELAGDDYVDRCAACSRWSLQSLVVAIVGSRVCLAAGVARAAVCPHRCLPRFMELLAHVDVEVRAAAGENIAMLHEATQKSGLSLPFDDGIVDKFREMSKDSSKKNSKKDRKVQRMVFRDVYATLAVRGLRCAPECDW